MHSLGQQTSPRPHGVHSSAHLALHNVAQRIVSGCVECGESVCTQTLDGELGNVADVDAAADTGALCCARSRTSGTSQNINMPWAVANCVP